MTNDKAKTKAQLIEELEGLRRQVTELEKLENQRRRAEKTVERRAAQLALINDIGGKIAAVLELDRVLDRAARLVQESFGYHHVALFTMDPEQDTLVMRAKSGDFAHLFPPDHRLKLGQGMVGWVSVHGETLLADDVSAEPHYVNLYPDVIRTRSELCAPIRVGEEIVGVLDVQSLQLEAFDRNDVMVMETLADQIAVAIENARLYETTQKELAERKRAEKEAQRRAAQTALSYEVSQRVSGELELDEFLSAVATSIHEAFDYYGVMLLLLDEEAECLTMRSVAGNYADVYPKDFQLAIGEGMIGHAAMTGEPQASGNVTKEPHYLHRGKEETKSELAVPIKSGQKVIGVLDLQSDELDAFDEIDAAAMEAISAQIATGIENAHLFEETRRRAEELVVLNELGQALTASLSVDEVLKEAYRQTSRLLDTTNFYIALHDPEKDEITFPFSVDSEQHDWSPIKKGKGLTNHVIETRQSLLLPTGVIGLNKEAGQEIQCDEIGIPAHSWLGVPLMIGGRALGVMTVQSYTTPGLYDEHDQDLLTSIASQAAIALQNAYLFEETHSRAQRLAVVNRVAKAASATLDLDDLLEKVYAEIAPAFQADAFFISLYDKESNEMDFRFLIDEGVRQPPERRPLGPGLTSIIITEKRALISRSAQEFARLEPSAHQFGTTAEIPVSWLGVPMLVGERIVGVINVQAYHPNAWDEEDELLLFTIADQVAVAIENVRLYEAIHQELSERKRAEEEARRRASQAALLYTVGQRVSGKLELENLLSTIVTTIYETFDYHSVALLLTDEKTDCLVLRSITGNYASEFSGELRLAIGEGMIGHAAATGETQISGDVRKNAHYVRHTEEKTESELAVPIKSGQKIIGVLDLQSDEFGAFDETDLATMEALSAQIATAIENARLFEETRSRAEELAVLNELGQALTARLSVNEVLEEAYRQTSRLLDTRNFAIGLYNSEKDEISFPFFTTESEIDEQILVMPASQGMNGYAIRNRTGVLIRENLRDWHEEVGIEMVGEPSLCWLGVPLMIGDQMLGVISVQSFTTPRLYDEHDQDLLTTIASQVAIALQNAYLFEETRSRAQRLAVVNRVAKVAGATLRLDDLMEAVYKEVTPAFQPDGFFIALCDEEAGELDYRFLVDKGIKHPPERHPLGVGLSSIVVDKKAPLIIRNIDNEPEYHSIALLMGTGEPSASWLGVPMLVGERVVGVINMQSYSPESWDKEDELLLFTIADQVAVAIENARLYEEIAHRLGQTRMLQEVMTAAASTLDFDQVLARVIQAIHRTMGIEHLGFVLPHESGDYLVTHPHYVGFDASPDGSAHLSLEKSVCGRVYTTGKPELISDTAKTPYYYASEGAPILRSELTVPVRAGDRVVAVLNAESPNPNAFTEDDLHTFETIAAQLGIVMENVRLYEKVEQELAERKQAEERIRESEEKYRASFDDSRDAINVFSKDRKFLDANKKLLQLSGYSKEELLSMGLEELYPEAVASKTGERLRTLVQGQEVPVFETDLLTKEGTIIPVEIGITRLENCYGQEFVFQGSIRDITDRKRSEKALEQKARELARSNAELEQFAYVASHDLQEPLRMVRSYLQLLERRYEEQLDEDANEFIWFAVDGATRMQTLINDLLTYSRVTTRARPFEPTDCSTVLDFVLTDLKVAIEENDAVVTHDPLPTVMADETQLKQLLQNLVGNGLKFHQEDTRPEVHVGAKRQGNGWTFSVRDNGIGIDSKYFERVFAIFQRLHSRDEYPGTGIGLAVCKKIVERHGGRIWAESKPGQGSTFYFTIPDREESTA